MVEVGEVSGKVTVDLSDFDAKMDRVDARLDGAERSVTATVAGPPAARTAPATAPPGREATLGPAARGLPGTVSPGREPETEAGANRRERRREENERRRSRESNRLLRGLATTAVAGLAFQDVLRPLTSLLSAILAAPFVGPLNKLAAAVAGPVTGGLGLIDKTTDVLGRGTFGGERGFETGPGTALGRARSRFQSSRESGFLRIATGEGRNPFGGVFEFGAAVGFGVHEAGRELWAGYQRWRNPPRRGRNPDSLSDDPNQDRARSSGVN